MAFSSVPLTTPGYVTFTFPTPYVLSAGTNYVIMVEWTAATSNYVQGPCSGNTHAGNSVSISDTGVIGWNNVYDAIFKVYGQ